LSPEKLTFADAKSGNWKIVSISWPTGAWEWPTVRQRLCSRRFAVNDRADQLQERAMRFAIDVCALIKLLPSSEPGPTVRRQLAKCSTSVAMNYRSSRRARSHAEFTSRIGIVADEAPELQRLLQEAGELRNVFAASYATARYRHRTESR